LHEEVATYCNAGTLLSGCDGSCHTAADAFATSFSTVEYESGRCLRRRKKRTGHEFLRDRCDGHRAHRCVSGGIRQPDCEQSPTEHRRRLAQPYDLGSNREPLAERRAGCRMVRRTGDLGGGRVCADGRSRRAGRAGGTASGRRRKTELRWLTRQFASHPVFFLSRGAYVVSSNSYHSRSHLSLPSNIKLGLPGAAERAYWLDAFLKNECVISRGRHNRTLP